jgi:hypothetical protein
MVCFVFLLRLLGGSREMSASRGAMTGTEKASAIITAADFSPKAPETSPKRFRK